MKRLLFSFILFLFTIILPSYSYAQTVTVTGHSQSGNGSSVTAGTFTRFRLRNYSGNVPRVATSGTIVQVQFDVTPVAGVITTPIYANDDITPANTFWTVETWFNGQFQFSYNYVICRVTNLGNCSATVGSTFNLDNATPISAPTPPPITNGQLIPVSFICPNTIAATTWTCTHSFGDTNVIVDTYDSTGKLIIPNSVQATNGNTVTITFTSPQSGTAVILHSSSIFLALNQPNAVVTNPTGTQTIIGSFAFNVESPMTASNLSIGLQPNAVALNSSATAPRIATLPDNTGTLAEINLAETWSAAQTFNVGDLLLNPGPITLSSGATAPRTQTLQNVSDTFVYLGTTDTLTNKTLASPILVTPTLSGATNTKPVCTNGSAQLTTTNCPSISSNMQVFVVSGTWVKPPNTNTTIVTLIGGGGGGGGGSSYGTGPSFGGGGGGGGGYTSVTLATVNLNTNETITVGSGGTGGAAAGGGAPSAGNSGSASSFGLWAQAGGGGGALAINNNNGGAGGTGQYQGGAGGPSPGLAAGNKGSGFGGAGGGGGGYVTGGGTNPGNAGGAGSSLSNGLVLGGTGGNNGSSCSNGGGGGNVAADIVEGGGGGGGGGAISSGTSCSGGGGGIYGGGGGGGAGAPSGFIPGPGGAGASGIVVVFSF